MTIQSPLESGVPDTTDKEDMDTTRNDAEISDETTTSTVAKMRTFSAILRSGTEAETTVKENETTENEDETTENKRDDITVTVKNVENEDEEQCVKGSVTNQVCKKLSLEWCDQKSCSNGAVGECKSRNNVDKNGCCMRHICSDEQTETTVNTEKDNQSKETTVVAEPEAEADVEMKCLENKVTDQECEKEAKVFEIRVGKRVI